MFPGALPSIYDALRVCMGWAWSYVVVAEFVAAASGIGHVVIESQRYLKTSEVFAAILTIGLIGVAFDQVFQRLKGVFFPWMVRHS
jgi:NitT/TauT family transport system permease protein